MSLIKNALANLKHSKVRVFSAMLWIVIGIASVVTVAGVGVGIKDEIMKASTGEEKRIINVNFSAYNSKAGEFIQPFTRDDVEFITMIEGVEKVNLFTTEAEGERDLISFNKRSASVELINGKLIERASQKVFIDQNLDIIAGRPFGFEDENRNSVVIGYNAASNLFGSPEEAIGNPIVNHKGDKVEVIGVLSLETSMDYEMGIEYAYFSKKVHKNMEYNNYDDSVVGVDSITLNISPGYDIDDTAELVALKLNQKNGVESGEYYMNRIDNELVSLQEIDNMMTIVTTILTFVSLFVGGFGIMNIMYLSVTQRRREIGVRRAIGAKTRNIITQFLVESAAITLSGGVLGTIIGILIGTVTSKVLGLKIEPTFGVYFFAISSSVLIGLIFGIIPAIKAARIDPIKAIQGE